MAEMAFEKEDFWKALCQPEKRTCFNCINKEQYSARRAPCNGCMKQYPKTVLWEWDGKTHDI